MKEQFERFSMEIASGASRRGALYTFLAGFGATLIGRPVQAEQPSKAACMTWCKMQAQMFLEVCAKASETCPPGFCAKVPVPAINSIYINTIGSPAGSSRKINTINNINNVVPQYCVRVGAR